MRKWICLGVLGGLLEFGIIYQVAFTDSQPAPDSERTSVAEPAKQKHSQATHQQKKTSSPSRREVPSPANRGDLLTASVAMASGTTTDTSRTDATQAALDALRARLAEPPPASEEASVPEPEPLAEAAETEAKEEPAQTAESGRPTQEPVSAPEPAADLASLPVTELIRTVFGPHGEKAISVAWCESSFRTEAQSGQYLGLFQMGSNERDRYGHGPDAITQVQSAYALFLERGWQPWTCG